MRLDRDDLAVMAIAEGSTCAAVFTWNRFPAAPVTLAREHLALTPPRFLLVNSGIANATDAAVSRPLLDVCLEHAVAQSFNRITVDGDTSTNDACVLVATARAPAPPITEPAGEAHQAFSSAVTEVGRTLARAIVRDGEGATKFVSVEVGGCPNEGAALEIARAVANSPLVKTALFASDPNWGRILAAVGRAMSPDIDAGGLTIYLNGLCVFRDGTRAAGLSEEDARAAMAVPEIVIAIDFRQRSPRRHGLDLRSLLRLRPHQRRVPQLIPRGRAALRRELREELGIEITIARPLIRVQHQYPDRAVLLDCWRVSHWEGEIHGREGQRIAWARPEALDERRFLPADKAIITAARLPALYLISPEPSSDLDAFLATLDARLGTGVRLFQPRCRDIPLPRYRLLVREARALCERYGARLLLNSALG